ncbi:Site-specific recombinase XerD [Methylomagnum ishizawai]|uniref:Site-specific recombinase XerD n=1 Tax=Methylomagnum ishizawai TaxID=1760988 RepID=A0A1Y6D3J9_9GAMM|nr:site-specific integrase [Methylomagnum ishizawai]SMF97227.1 Site-specific recombinase XerD [Methylomagnum ishizawai]
MSDGSKKFRFTKRDLENLPAHPKDSPSRETEYSDTECVGLKMLVNRQGRKFFYYRYSHKKRRHGIKIGEFPSMSLVEARQRANELRAMVDRGIDPQAAKRKENSVPFFKSFALDQYMPYAENTKRSHQDDRSRLEQHLIPQFGRLALDAITTQMVQHFLADALKKGLAPATVNRLRSLLHRLFGLAVQWEIIAKNPVHGIPKFQENNQRQRFLNADEIRALYRALDDDPNPQAADFIRLLLLTGARVGELLNAEHAHIDLEAGIWRIPRSKSGKARIVPLNDVAKALLGRQAKRAGNAFVFPGAEKYGNARMAHPQHAFDRVKKRAGLTDFRMHDLRHTHASLAVGRGSSLYDVQKLLGHSSPNMTQRYAHLADGRLMQASNGVADAVEEAIRK